jgi:hypothetical protein
MEAIPVRGQARATQFGLPKQGASNNAPDKNSSHPEGLRPTAGIRGVTALVNIPDMDCASRLAAIPLRPQRIARRIMRQVLR